MQIRNTALKGLGLQSSFQTGALSALKAPVATAIAAGSSAGGAAAAAQRPSFAKMLSAVHTAFPVLRSPPARSDLAIPADTLSAIVAFLNSCQEEQEKEKTSNGPVAANSKDETMKDTEVGADEEDEEMQVEEEGAGPGSKADLSEAGLVYGCGAHVAVLEHGVVRCATQQTLSVKNAAQCFFQRFAFMAEIACYPIRILQHVAL